MRWKNEVVPLVVILLLMFPMLADAQNSTPIENRDQLIYRHANTKGLIFFFRSDCPYCKQFAPVIKHVEKRYRFNTIAVSLDGSYLLEYPNAQADHALGTLLGVSHVPAVFMVNPDTNTISTVTLGFSTFIEFQDQIVSAGRLIDSQGVIE